MRSNEESKIKSGIYQKDKINLETLISSIKKEETISKAGSILVFNGIVRETSQRGEIIKKLSIDAYDELANKSIDKICNDLKNRNGIIDVRIIHLKGEFQITDDLVYVVIASAHREEGFKALRDAVERYKKEIEVWKKEEFINDREEWVH
jgi:molybdopterin synthase catalytic subunit